MSLLKLHREESWHAEIRCRVEEILLYVTAEQPISKGSSKLWDIIAILQSGEWKPP